MRGNRRVRLYHRYAEEKERITKKRRFSGGFRALTGYTSQ